MINKVVLIGNLGRDPEVRTFDGGNKVGKFPIATNESYRDNAGNWQTKTEWHDIVVWRNLAERAEQQLKKGMLVYVEGKLTHRKYTDNEGKDRYITEVVARTFRLLEKRENSDYSTSNFPEPSDQTSSGSFSEPSKSSSSGFGDSNMGNSDEEDDLPF